MEHLARRLSLPLSKLESVAKFADLLYNPTTPRAKKSGAAPRPIDAPKPRLKAIQRRIHVELLAPLWLPDSIHGYRIDHSILSASKPHEGRPFWWKADIKRFYPSITYTKVYAIFEGLGCTPNVARLLTRLTTRNYHLPQGAPTSPTLANLYLRHSGIARRLDGLARRHQLNVTFFGDDVLVSSDRPFMGLQRHLEQVITSTGLRLSREKTGSVVGPDERHFALGIVTNADGQDTDVPRSFRRHLRKLLFLCRRYGPEALSRWGITQTDPRKFLMGKIGFAVFVNPDNRSLLTELDRIRW